MTELSTEFNILDVLLAGTTEVFWRRFPESPHLAHGPLDRFPEVVRTLSVTTLSEMYSGDINVHGRSSRPVTINGPSPEAVAWLAERAEGITFESVEAAVPELHEWCADLAVALALPRHFGRPRCHAFTSPAAGGYRFHFHYEGALLVQLEGNKTVRLAPAAAPFPAIQADRNQRFDENYAVEPRPMGVHAQFAKTGFLDQPDESTTIDYDLRPGSVLYIPPGFWHATSAGSGPSFAFNFFLPVPRAYEVFVRALQLALLTDPQWRAPMATGGAQQDLSTPMPERHRAFIRAAQALRHEDILRCLGQSVPISVDTTLCPNPDHRHSFATTPDGTEILKVRSDRDYELELDADSIKVLRILLQQSQAFTLRSVEGCREADEDLATTAAELLVQVGALIPGSFAV